MRRSRDDRGSSSGHSYSASASAVSSPSGLIQTRREGEKEARCSAVERPIAAVRQRSERRGMEITDVHTSKRFRMGSSSSSSAVGGGTPEALLAGHTEMGAGTLGLRPWYQYPSTASRICRVSRASGGKDRHSKVLTAKGLRDRRVRLSVSTAIQFYDLQDRLGYDQPSKAVEWLIKAAAVPIADLPSLDGVFPDQPLPENEGKSPMLAVDDEDNDFEYASQQHQGDEQQMQQQEHLSLAKSACSSTSETSRGSVLSLSRSEIRIKARERARERAATAKKVKDKDGDEDDDTQIASAARPQSLDVNPASHSSFIELLTGGSGGNQHQNQNQLPVSSSVVTADYFGQQQQQQPPPAQQQFSFLPDHLIPLAVTAAGGDCINFSIASGVAGFNRGTLQSNFPPPQPLHHLQRLSGGPNLPFFLGAAAAGWEGQLPNGFDSRLQLFYDGYPHLDLKGKDKS